MRSHSGAIHIAVPNIGVTEESRVLSALFYSGLELMLVGMSTVFAFLSVLVVAMHVMAKVVHRFAPAEVAAPASGIATASDAAVSAEEVAAISMALSAHLAKSSDRIQP